MSYLASIVARANGTAPVLQPRLASRYESGAPAAESAFAEIAVERIAPPPVSHAPATESPETPSLPTARRDEPPSSPRPLTPSNEHPPLHAAMPQPAPATHTERIVERHHTERIESREEILTTLAPSIPPLLPPPAERSRVDASPREVRAAEPGEAPLRELLLPSPAPLHASSATRGEGRTTQGARDEARDAAAPTIRVTIGRVDVRAVNPPAQTRPAPAPRAAFTLDDYVRLRKEGRRS